MPAERVLEALNQLETTQSRAGIPQSVRRDGAAGAGKGPRISLDLSHVAPLALRDPLEKALAGPSKSSPKPGSKRPAARRKLGVRPARTRGRFRP
jgi:hypothetical protein